MKCPICESETKEFGSKQRKCTRCRHIFSTFAYPDYANLKGYFDEIYKPQGIQFDSKEEAWMNYIMPRYLTLKRHRALTHGRVVEIGCLEGKVLEYIQENTELNTYGYEPIKEIAEISVGTVFNCKFEDAEITPNSINTIYSFHVFEHLENPVAVVAKIREALTYGGKLFIEVPLFDDDYNNPHHLHFYTLESLLELLKDFKEHMITIGEYTRSFDSKICKNIQISCCKA